MNGSQRLDRLGDEHLSAASDLLARSLVWDNHTCMPLRPGDTSFLRQLEGVHRSGVDVVSLNVGFGPQDASAHLAMLESFRAWISSSPTSVRLIGTTSDIAAARAAGQLGVLFDVEGMGPLSGNHIDQVQVFRDLGVGWMLVAYNNANDAGGGCVDPDGGLTAYGRLVLAEMKHAGMMVCCSHTGHRTAMDVMACADNPVIFSHSNPAAVFAHYRNIPDELIRVCAETGGVVGINGVGAFLGRGGEATPQRVAEHIDYVVQLVGPLHVGLGLDYVYDRQELLDYLAQMRATFPDDATFESEPDFLHPDRLAEVVSALMARGYAVDDLTNILGGNWLRVAAHVWKP